MTINPEQKTEFRNVWIKTAEQQLFQELETEYGFPRATCRSLVQLMQEFIEQNYGNLRGDNQIIYHAISKDERKTLDALTSKGKHKSQNILNALILLSALRVNIR